MRPLGVGAVLDGALKLYRSRFGTLVGLAALLLGLAGLISFLLTKGAVDDATNASTLIEFNAALERVNLIGSLTSLAQYAVITPLLTGACVSVIGATYLGKKVGIGRALRTAGRRFPSLLWALVLSTLILLAGMIGSGLIIFGVGAVAGPVILVLVLPVMALGLWLYVIVLMSLEIVMLEGVRGGRAVSRWLQLVKGHGGRVWWTMFCAMVLMIALAFVLGFLLGMITQGNLTPADQILVSSVVSTAISILTTPFLTAVAVLVYFDLCIRKEGMDLAVMAQQLAQPGR